jgi:site-specific recombinase XerD
MTSPSSGKTYPAGMLTPAEVQALISACSPKSATGIRNRALLTLLYRSGLRISEVVGYPGRPEQKITLPDGGEKIQAARPPIPPLKVSDVNLDAHTIRLQHTKSGTAQTRGFHPSATDALARWLDVRRQLGINGRQALFCTLRGEPLSEQYVRALLGRLGAKAGIDKRIHPHALRHTFAVELERAGMPVSQISKLLGHSSIAVTSRYLDHLTNGEAVTFLEGVELPPLED